GRATALGRKSRVPAVPRGEGAAHPSLPLESSPFGRPRGVSMTATAPLDFVDSDGHVLEHPDGMLEYAPTELADRIWHIETDADGTEWGIYDRQRLHASGLALAGTAGMTLEERERAQRGELRDTEVRPAAYNARARLADMGTNGIGRASVAP